MVTTQELIEAADTAEIVARISGEYACRYELDRLSRLVIEYITQENTK